MTNKYSYVLIGDQTGSSILGSPETPKLSGLYLWAEAFEKYGSSGNIEPIWRKEDLEKYDIVHINYTPSNINLPTTIKNELRESSSTKLIMNVDLDISHWSASWAYHLNSMIRELLLADHIFHVEPYGSKLLSHMFDRTILTIPHPVDVSNIYDSIKAEREPVIGSIFHRYTGETMTHYISQKNIPLRRVLFGYSPIAKQAMVANAGMFDQVLMMQSFKNHIEELSKCQIGCDLYSGYTFGRSVVELAALGIPSVVSSTIYSSHWLFPETRVHPFDTKTAEELLTKIYKNENFANETIKFAHNGCKYYNLEYSYDRFISDLMEN